MTRDRLLSAARVLILAGILATRWLTLRTAGAQEPAPPPERVEAIARVTVGEAGWTIRDDHAAITHLLVRRADRLGLLPREMARAYSGLHFDRERTDRRRWIADLHLDGRRPRGWPAGLRWSRYAPRWQAVIEHVSAALRGDVPDPCAEPVDHWGAPSLDRTELGWVRVDCGETLNVYWRIPRGGDES